MLPMHLRPLHVVVSKPKAAPAQKIMVTSQAVTDKTATTDTTNTTSAVNNNSNSNNIVSGDGSVTNSSSSSSLCYFEYTTDEISSIATKYQCLRRELFALLRLLSTIEGDDHEDTKQVQRCRRRRRRRRFASHQVDSDARTESPESQDLRFNLQVLSFGGSADTIRTPAEDYTIELSSSAGRRTAGPPAVQRSSRAVLKVSIEEPSRDRARCQWSVTGCGGDCGPGCWPPERTKVRAVVPPEDSRWLRTVSGGVPIVALARPSLYQRTETNSSLLSGRNRPHDHVLQSRSLVAHPTKRL